MNIVIHVGSWKTGSTTIQKFCAQNRTSLLNHGICYPGTDLNHLLYLLPCLSGSFETSQKYLDLFINESIHVNTSIILLSGEGLQPIIPYLNFYEHSVHIIQYIRQFPAYNESTLSQSIKATYSGGWRGLNNRKCIAFYGIHQLENITTRLHIYRCNSINTGGADGEIAWTKKIAKQHRIETFSYEDACKEGLIRHFCAQIGISDLSSFTLPPKKANVTPCTAALFFMAHCNCLPILLPLREELLAYLEQNQVTEDTKKYLLVAPDTYRQWMRDEHATMQEMADLIGDPQWIDKCYAWLENKEVVPYDNLPPRLQHEIFANLPAHFQEAIREAWIIARIARSDEALLPPFPPSIELQECIQSWHDAYLDQYFKMEALNQEAAALRNEVENMHALALKHEQNMHHFKAETEALHDSLSWRITAPLRALAAPVARIFKK